MKDEEHYIRDIAEIRSMMERSSKFLSLSGWAGIVAGILALAGVFVAWSAGFNPTELNFSSSNLLQVIVLACAIFILAMTIAIFLSYKRAQRAGEKIWNATTRRLLTAMAVPLLAGGILVLIFVFHGLTGLIAPCTLLFYGLALFNASKLTVAEVQMLGFVQMALGLFAFYFIQYGMICWALGFGVAHIVYGIYMYFRYEK